MLVFLSATKQARLTASTASASRASTPQSHYSTIIDDVEDEDGPIPVPGIGDPIKIAIHGSNHLLARRSQKQQTTIIESDEEDEETGSTSMDNAAPCVQKKFSSGVCFI